MKARLLNNDELCPACVYYPPNLPVSAYAEEDFRMLQAKSCSFDFLPGDPDCMQTRKTSCSLIDLNDIKHHQKSKERIE